MTRRALQIVLGLLWVLDGALQLQPVMLGAGFARDVIAPAGAGQPAFVHSGVHWSVQLILGHPASWDIGFAAIQLAIGIGLLVPRPAVVRLAIVTSVCWALGVWYFGEGLGGLASGQVDLVTGAPGAVLLYAILGLAAWPTGAPVTASGPSAPARPASWIAIPWAVLWVAAAGWQAMPAQQGVTAVAGDVHGNANGAPDWLAALDRTTASSLASTGKVGAVIFVILLALVGLGGLLPGTPRRVAAVAGIVTALAIWIFGQSFGELYTGSATDPNTAPLIIVWALALASAGPLRGRRPHASHARPDSTRPTLA